MKLENSPDDNENVVSLGSYRPQHFRPCGTMDEYLDDPLEELLNEFSEFDAPPGEQEEQELSFWSKQKQDELGIGEILKESQKSMSPIQRLRFSVMKTKKDLNELHYYSREVKLHLGI